MGSQEKSPSILIMFSILQDFFSFADLKVIAKVWIALSEILGCDRRHYTLFYINVLKIDIIYIIFHF